MCIASRVSAMLRRIASCSCSCGGGSSSVVDEEEDFDLDFPTMSPKLTLTLSRQETSRGAACSGSASDMSLDSPFPPMSAERLKPQPFRRKDPPMHFQASVRGDRQELNKWLISGGDPNSRDEEGWALLHHASMHGREGCVGLLLRYGARHDRVAIGGHTVLHLASANRHCEVVKRLVEAGGRVNARNSHGNTPVHSAAATGTVEVLSYLLSQSANPDAVNSLGETPEQVSGATAEVVHLLQAARRLKKARIAQRFALVKIHCLSNSGRAKPNIGVVISAAEAANDDSRYRERQARTAGEKKAVEDATGGGSASPEVASTSRVLGGDEPSVGQQQQQPRPSLDCTVAAIAGLPQEVLRRIVGYCTL
ncbi:conserved unknown protein [Ectocarpus siliculosus]|uniref:Uncharacterized protein n=1 Tax=Ectocarpus siliculosus TaxID=2880 RepID=D7FY30_ECTSI|nr:conserved unknown protein [Ectocarpus siliculosus]|eukprot:CBJ32443.1 conserved unknown protein [Ectocarpus siliculosus]